MALAGAKTVQTDATTTHTHYQPSRKPEIGRASYRRPARPAKYSLVSAVPMGARRAAINF